ncbi:hypothetical protein DSL64_08840 [Dyadobacter luteus]|jgi:hypothetical protein|uniref:Uncharacterized protein n=1 Tax=Dyadobacter luteus TaxID=2259619 RepID=A0A3D8YGA2_9BACT|nr:hypothetical protein [Dyadobacter luteus]REA62359.1 hypothetical protein DSL64_08840 [Dyadobacter luteus]
MKSIYHFSIIILVSLSVFSCKTTSILRTNFNASEIGVTPAHDLPGAPSGDRVDFNDALIPGLKIRQWNTSGTKGLEYSQVNTGDLSGHYTWLSFRGISTNFAETIWYIYSARHNSSSGDILTDLTDGSGVPIARMRITSSGAVSLISGDWTTSRVIGNIPPGAVHSVIFTVLASQLKYNLLITSPGREPIKVTNEPMMTTSALNFHNPANPSISFQHSDRSGQDSKYTIESISISRKDPN